MDQATVLCEGGDVAMIACGEMVNPAKAGGGSSESKGRERLRRGHVLPQAVRPGNRRTRRFRRESGADGGGTRSYRRARLDGQPDGRGGVPRKVVNLSLPDAPVVTGTSKEVFDYYGLNAEGIAKKAVELVK